MFYLRFKKPKTKPTPHALFLPAQWIFVACFIFVLFLVFLSECIYIGRQAPYFHSPLIQIIFVLTPCRIHTFLDSFTASLVRGFPSSPGDWGVGNVSSENSMAFAPAHDVGIVFAGDKLW